MKRLVFSSGLLAGVLALHACKAPAPKLPLPDEHLSTAAGRSVDPDNVLPEYPRPQLVRSRWQSLNGWWEFAEAQAGDSVPTGAPLSNKILVPFPMESALSGIGRHLDRAWYRRTFDVPNSWKSKRLILHFGAVDWQATVYVNGTKVTDHRGGYDPFEVDVTDALKPSGSQELIVGVFDPSDQGDQPRGKQVSKPEGIFYTSSSGIWQTVWMEPVPRAHVDRLEISADMKRSDVVVFPRVQSGEVDLTVQVTVLGDGREIARESARPNAEIRLQVPNFRPWTPDSPYLYALHVTLMRGPEEVDEVDSYFGMRSVEVRPDGGGVPRIALNGKPIFGIGVLDQGFWPDGLYTAPSDAALKGDIELVKKLGFNTIRKHVKVEPERWYFWCDTLGVLVWQDMPSGDNKTGEGKRQFERELASMVKALENHPSIIMWVVFNEGWGQYDTPRLTAQVKHLDPLRLVSNASGWTDAKAGDVLDVHVYPGPGAPEGDRKRAAVLGEFGGLGLGVPQHTWMEKTWGYKGVRDGQDLTEQYVELLRQVWQLEHENGLCAAIYTQLTDVETECNGLVTYDRAVVKPDVARISAANQGKVPKLTTVVPCGKDSAVGWRFRLDAPGDDAWTGTDYDDKSWSEGAAGFGSKGTPGAIVRTEWTTSDIWLRRAFTLDATAVGDLRLLVHHDEDAEIYVNGVLAARLEGFTTSYGLASLSPDARRALVQGRNVIAIHCKQTTGGQYIDAGLVRVD